MKIYIVRGEHWYVPGVATSLHWTKATADVKAGELVDQLIADLDEEVERPHFVDPASGRWEDRLQAAQLARITGSDEELSDETRAAIKGEHVFGYDSPAHYFAELSEGDIWIEENEIPAILDDRAVRVALRLLEADRSIFFNCHTVAGDPASLSANEACVIAAYDEAINGLKTAIAKAEGRDL